MKTLALDHGDLVVGSTGYAMIDGVPKVLQDVRCALLEPLGNDRFHPGFGSSLDSFVGSMQDEMVISEVQGEVRRVLDQYAAVQRDRLERDALSGARSRYKTADVLAARVYVQVALRTADGSTVVLNTSVGATA